MKKLLILLFSILISFNSYGETETDYYENGQIKIEANYKDEKKDGKWTSWYENGQIKLERNYKDDHIDGKWTEWDENGQIKSEAIYKDGVCINFVSRDSLSYQGFKSK